MGAAARPASCVPAGALAGLQWQGAQVRLAVSTAPFTCRPPATSTAPPASTVPEWHLLQVVRTAALWWLAVPGGDLWQLPQSAAAPFQAQLATLPRVVVAFRELPWQ